MNLDIPVLVGLPRRRHVSLADVFGDKHVPVVALIDVGYPEPEAEDLQRLAEVCANSVLPFQHHGRIGAGILEDEVVGPVLRQRVDDALPHGREHGPSG